MKTIPRILCSAFMLFCVNLAFANMLSTHSADDPFFKVTFKTHELKKPGDLITAGLTFRFYSTDKKTQGDENECFNQTLPEYPISISNGSILTLTDPGDYVENAGSNCQYLDITISYKNKTQQDPITISKTFRLQYDEISKRYVNSYPFNPTIPLDYP